MVNSTHTRTQRGKREEGKREIEMRGQPNPSAPHLLFLSTVRHLTPVPHIFYFFLQYVIIIICLGGIAHFYTTTQFLVHLYLTPVPSLSRSGCLSSIFFTILCFRATQCLWEESYNQGKVYLHLLSYSYIAFLFFCCSLCFVFLDLINS